jgi:hypothetical protein
MKIVSLVGSPHGKKGNTARLLEEVLKGAASLGAKKDEWPYEHKFWQLHRGLK